MRLLILFSCLLLSYSSLSQVHEGSGPTAESAFINACTASMINNVSNRQTEMKLGTLLETEERMDTTIGNLILQYVSNHIDSNVFLDGNKVQNAYEEVFKIQYSDDQGRTYKMDCSVRFDEDQNNFASIERFHTQTYNMTFEGVLEYLQTQGYEIKHRTEQPPFKSLLQEPIHYISIKYKKP